MKGDAQRGVVDSQPRHTANPGLRLEVTQAL
jgi:hypothetical protein